MVMGKPTAFFFVYKFLAASDFNLKQVNQVYGARADDQGVPTDSLKYRILVCSQTQSSGVSQNGRHAS